MWDSFWTGIHGMRFFKHGHYIRQRKKKAERQKDQEALVCSGENIKRKDRRKRKRFSSCLTGLQWEGKTTQPLATLKRQSHANALLEKVAHLLALYTLQHSKAASWVVLVRLIRSCSNCDKQWWVHSARPCSWQSLVKALLLFIMIVFWPEFKLKKKKPKQQTTQNGLLK